MNNSQLDQRLLGDIPSTPTGIGLTNIIHTRINQCTSTAKGRGSLTGRAYYANMACRVLQECGVNLWRLDVYGKYKD